MKRTVLAAIIATAMTALVSVPAFAFGPPYTVAVGSNTFGTYSISASDVFNTSLVVKPGNYSLSCSHMSLSFAYVSAGSNRNPVITTMSPYITGCSYGGMFGSLAEPKDSYWTFRGTGNATTGNDTVAGYVENIRTRATFGAICSFTMSGSANASLNEASQRLVINEQPGAFNVGNLTVSSVSGCGGQIQNGQKVTLAATLAITSQSGAIRLS